MDAKTDLTVKIELFILDNIDTVPHLEALLLLWNSRPKRWQAEHIAHRLYVQNDVANLILRDLARKNLIEAFTSSANEYGFERPKDDMARLLDALDTAYRNDLIRISNLIHSKARPSLRDLARALRFTKK